MSLKLNIVNLVNVAWQVVFYWQLPPCGTSQNYPSSLQLEGREYRTSEFQIKILMQMWIYLYLFLKKTFTYGIFNYSPMEGPSGSIGSSINELIIN